MTKTVEKMVLKNFKRFRQEQVIVNATALALMHGRLYLI